MRDQKLLFVVSSLVLSSSFTLEAKVLGHFSDSKKSFKRVKHKVDVKKSELFTSEEYKNWLNLDPHDDNYQGVSTYKAENYFSEPTTKTIIVAVIDSGVDVNHKDLDGKIWVNKNEIPNNGIDDDNNGYVDDIYGWNFIGGKNGNAKFKKTSKRKNPYELIEGSHKNQLKADTFSSTRELIRLRKKQTSSRLTSQESEELFKLENLIEQELEFAQNSFRKYDKKIKSYEKNAKILKAAGVEPLTYAKVSSFLSLNKKEMDAKKVILDFLNRDQNIETLLEEREYFRVAKDHHYNVNDKSRSLIVGDDINNFHEKGYGNNNVNGPGSDHGTHVAGIIAANRNKIGNDGISENVKIMALKVIPDGDERDKDVAAAIYYAVNNGAKVINLSFGKQYSPYKTKVSKAIEFAQINNVIIVHAAGNENNNNDEQKSYPSPFKNNVRFFNWFEIGASGPHFDNTLIADFSNFGQQTVDFFAPGVDIYSTTPGNKHEFMSGTSMAAPVTAGVIAQILAYNNDISVMSLKSSLIDNLNNVGRLYIFKPGLGNVSFNSLSKYDGTPNLFKTLKSLGIR